MVPPPDPATDGQPRKSQGEIEAAVCDAISRFQQEYMGRGPRHVHTHLVDNMLFVRLQGVLTAAEQRLIELRNDDNGRGAEIVKQFRSHLVTTGRPLLERMVHDVTGTPTINLHHDISAATGEEVIVFTLASPPECRDRRRKG
jgi:uncharacterized protein YbcI